MREIQITISVSYVQGHASVIWNTYNDTMFNVVSLHAPTMIANATREAAKEGGIIEKVEIELLPEGVHPE